MSKIFLIIFYFLSIYCPAYGQGTTPSYSANHRIYIQHELPFYFAGQDLNMEVLLLNPLDYTLVNKTEIIYVVLKDKKDSTIAFIKKKITEGKQKLSIKLPENLSTAYYELIAYTNSMRNYGEAFIYREKIEIYSPKFDDNLTQENSTAIFYPEGQHLINGITTRVALNIGYDIDSTTSGLIKNDKGKIVSEVKFECSRWGEFYLQPKNNQTYSLHLDNKDSSVMYDLPSAKQNGTALRITEQKQAFQILLQKSDNYVLNDPVYIYATNNNRITYKSQGKFKNNFLLTSITTENLSHGALNVYITDKYDSLLNFRSINIDNQKSEVSPTIELSNTTYSTRDTAVFIFEPSQVNSSTIIGLTVLPKAYSEIKKINHQQSLNQIDGNNSAILLPYLSDLQFISRTKSIQSLPIKKSSAYATEQYLTIKGILKDQVPLPSKTDISLFITGVNTVHKTTVDSTGIFNIPVVLEFMNSQKVFYQVYAKNHIFKNPQIVVDNEIIPQLLDLSGRPHFNPTVQAALYTHLIRKNIDDSYGYTKTINRDTQLQFNSQSISEIIDSDIVYRMEDYKVFPTMIEQLKETVPQIIVRKVKNNYQVRVYSKEINQTLGNRPIIFINNNPTFDSQKLLALLPEEINSIEIVYQQKSISNFSEFGENGIIIVDTNEFLETEKLEERSQFIVNGFTADRQSAPSYSGKNNPREPDMREVLLNEIKIYRNEINSPNLSAFITSDIPGEYIAEFIVLNPNGYLNYLSKPFTVVRNNSN